MNKTIRVLITTFAILVSATLIYTTTLLATNDYEETVIENTETKELETIGNITPRNYILIGTECFVVGAIISLIIFTSSFQKDIKSSLNSSIKIATFILLTFIIRTIIQTPIYLIIKLEIDNTIAAKETELEKTIGAQIYNDTKEINLSNYNTENITIKEEGEYTLTGSYNYVIHIDANGPVILNLNSVSIDTAISGAVINNKTNNDLTINLLGGLTNSFKSTNNGSSDYNGIISSQGDLVINGDGILNIETLKPNGSGIYCSNSSLEITSGIVNINSKSVGIQLQESKNQNEDIPNNEKNQMRMKGGSLYILAGKEAIETPNPVVVERGIAFLENSKVSSNEISFDIKDGTLIATNYQIASLVDSEKNPSQSVLLRFDLTSSPVEKGRIMSLKTQRNNSNISFITRTDTNIVLISDKKLQIGDIISLYKDGTNNGILINNVYYNGNYVPGVEALKNRINFTITNKISEFS
jgi:hypothetical protein